MNTDNQMTQEEIHARLEREIDLGMEQIRISKEKGEVYLWFWNLWQRVLSLIGHGFLYMK
jgi:hypothetical protein